MRTNPILNTDSYKASHFLQYPEGVTTVYSYIEARGPKDHDLLFFGLQMFIKSYLTTPITAEDIDEAEEIFTAHGLPFHREGWAYILEKHNGYMPIAINALKEGTVTKTSVPLALIYNTDPKCAWLTSYLETAILRGVWYPTTVATNSFLIKQQIKAALEKSSDDVTGQLPFKLHDFGARGASSQETAQIGGLAHLVNFQGTDTVSALPMARQYYGGDDPHFMAGFSIPAAEHSTMTSWGRAGEKDAYANMLEKFPQGLVAVVSDSYDLFNALENIWGDELKEQVLARDGTLVVRPDSGDPVEIVCQTLEVLGDKFGYSTNSKGFKVLDPHVRVIQGDGIYLNSLKDILDAMIEKGWAVDNVAFGMGGGLLQAVSRDSYQFAMKACAIERNGDIQPIYKEPKTDKKKTSKRGIQGVFEEQGQLVAKTILPEQIADSENMLKRVYWLEQGVPQITHLSFTEVRQQAEETS
ncbi:nicotinamide phosphoribosyltransferase [Maritalea mobilis]|uniref:Nicotinamide phosphoribosyltransferase n=1 Tax=Maritalea mobilis TaxID=483324 RepID=A0A4R6VFG5_9HYPH|nr:nicotinate phosphoribosyltransferase [Maritalea mobilis]TDQ61815.1 nicotinamide phosphoribosyltransferase [Maritalea mobilis]